MTEQKQQHLHAIRSDSAYPLYRSVIGTFALLAYILAGFMALPTGGSGLRALSDSFFMGIVTLGVGGVASAMIYFFARLSKEAALILVDLADSTLEANSGNGG